MVKRYKFIPPTILNSMPIWEEDPSGIWIKDSEHMIDVGQYQKHKKLPDKNVTPPDIEFVSP